VEVLDCEVYNISRGGVNVYAANDFADSWISNVLVRGCDIYATGQDPNYAGSALAAKNHVIDVTLEYNTIHDPVRGIGIGISTHAAGFTGPENLIIRHNIIVNSAHAGIYVQGYGDKSMDIYGNLIAQNQYHGIKFASSLADSLTARVYNNTFYQNYEPEWDSEIRVEANSADISVLEIRNNIIYADSDTRCLIDDEGNITNHSNNVYYRPGSDVLVIANGTSYTAGNVNTWEPTALTDDPSLVNSANLPTGFVGAFGVDMQPDLAGLNITADSPARDAGAALAAAYDSSINSATRPQGAGWDIGAYEFVPALDLYGTPGDGSIYLDWQVSVDPLPTSTWQISYYTDTVASTVVVTDSLTYTARAYTLTGLTNYQWYTVTLSAMVGPTPILTDTVRVMPTDISVRLPLMMKED
ncbi:MAG: right-handed parallel beta-helix repeat-containing protein, partial [Anaerolineae bacterium]